jgi:hypothetical protein
VIERDTVTGSLFQKEEINVVKKDEAKKMAGKASKVGKGLNSRVAEAKAPAKTQKKPARARAKTETTFRLEAPQAAQVFVVGCFNGWDPTASPLERDAEGTWSCALAIESGEHQYRFVVDGDWCDDPVNMLRCRNEFGTENCVLIV